MLKSSCPWSPPLRQGPGSWCFSILCTRRREEGVVRFVLGAGGSLLGDPDVARWLLRPGLKSLCSCHFPSLVYSLPGVLAPCLDLPTYCKAPACLSSHFGRSLATRSPSGEMVRLRGTCLLRGKSKVKAQGSKGRGTSSAALRGALGGLPGLGVWCLLGTPREAEGSSRLLPRLARRAQGEEPAWGAGAGAAARGPGAPWCRDQGRARPARSAKVARWARPAAQPPRGAGGGVPRLPFLQGTTGPLRGSRPGSHPRGRRPASPAARGAPEQAVRSVSPCPPLQSHPMEVAPDGFAAKISAPPGGFQRCAAQRVATEHLKGGH